MKYRVRQRGPTVLSGLTITLSPLPATPLGAPSSFAATVSAGTAPITYTWDFGDGTPARTGAQVAHTHALAGQFTAIVTATNSLGQLSTTAEVNVLAAASAKRRLYLPVVRR